MRVVEAKRDHANFRHIDDVRCAQRPLPSPVHSAPRCLAGGAAAAPALPRRIADRALAPLLTAPPSGRPGAHGTAAAPQAVERISNELRSPQARRKMTSDEQKAGPRGRAARAPPCGVVHGPLWRRRVSCGAPPLLPASARPALRTPSPARATTTKRCRSSVARSVVSRWVLWRMRTRRPCSPPTRRGPGPGFQAGGAPGRVARQRHPTGRGCRRYQHRAERPECVRGPSLSLTLRRP